MCAPARNGRSNFTPNHRANSPTSVRARQTRVRGAGSSIFFSIRSVAATSAICNLQVAYYSRVGVRLPLLALAELIARSGRLSAGEVDFEHLFALRVGALIVLEGGDDLLR